MHLDPLDAHFIYSSLDPFAPAKCPRCIKNPSHVIQYGCMHTHGCLAYSFHCGAGKTTNTAMIQRREETDHMFSPIKQALVLALTRTQA